METRLKKPAAFDMTRDDAGDIERWLVQQGFTVNGVSVTSGGDIIVDAVEEPNSGQRPRKNLTTALAAYEKPVSPIEKARNQLAQMDFDTADVAQMRAALTLLRDVVLGGES